MAIIRKKEMKTMTEGEIKKQLVDLKGAIMNERAKIKAGGMPENAGKLREMKKTIARLYTLAGEKKYNL